MTPPSAVVSLAFLKTEWDQNQAQYVDLFTPFVAIVVRSPPIGKDLAGVQSEIEAQFGLRIPQAALRTILRSAKRQDIVLEDDDGSFLPNPNSSFTSDFEQIRDAQVARYDQLAHRLLSFAKDQYGQEWTVEQARTSLDQYLAQYSEEILSARVAGLVSFADDLNDPSAGSAYIFARFVTHLHDSADGDFSAISDAVEGLMIAGALYFDKIADVGSRIQNLTAYLDTRLILRLLGHAGPELQVSAREIFDLSRTLGVEIRVFRKTFNEAEGVLDAAASFLRRPRQNRPYGEVIEHLLRIGGGSSTAELLSANLARDLQRIGVRVVDAPDHEVLLGVAEIDLQHDLQTAINYTNPAALHHDLDCLTAIHRLRRGQVMPLFENSRALFVTTNTPLARKARQFFRTEYDGYHVPVCLTERIFGTLLWVKSPISAPDLPTSRIVADCYAAVRPSDRFWREFLKEVDRLVESGTVAEEDAIFMRLFPTAQRQLMDDTIGGDAYNVDTVPALVASISERIRRDVEAGLVLVPPQVQVELAEGEDLHVERLEAERDTLRGLADEGASRARIAEDEAEELRSLVVHRAQQRALDAGRRASRIFLGVGVAIAAIGLLGAVSASLSNGSYLLSGVVRVLVVIACLVYFVMGFAGASHGWSIRGAARRIGERRYQRVLDRELGGLPLDGRHLEQ